MNTIAQIIVLPSNFTPPDARAHPTFSYSVPAKLEGVLLPGHFVLAPFGRHAAAKSAGGEARLVSGLVFKTLEVLETSRVYDLSYTGEIKPIHDLLDPQPVVGQAQLHLAQWMADTYLAPLCECARPFAPPGQTIHSDLEYALAPGAKSPARLGSLQAGIVAALGQRGALRAGQLSAAFRGQNWQAAIKPLLQQEIITARRMLPLPRTRPNMVRFVEPASPIGSDVKLGNNKETIERRRRALEFLQREGRPVQVEWVYAEAGCTAADIKFLEEKGWVKIRLQQVLRDPLADKEFVPVEPPALTADQASVWERLKDGIQDALVQSSSRVYLLHGVTGSGKTEIYLRAVAETLQAGRQAIVLVPEISLTPQTIRRFAVRFAGRVATWHSQMSTDEKYDTWQRIRAGQVDVVIGARSALFSPLQRLGLIVIDEEHESSYKQDIQSDLPFESPPYHAREAAIELARLSGAVVILGSATPSLETYTRAQRGEFSLLELPQRIVSHEQRVLAGEAHYHVQARYQADASAPEARFIHLPPVEVVDMRQELRQGNRHIFSRSLQAALTDVLKNNQQAILFLNRRGSATFVMCRDCGHVLSCPRCDIPLTYHEISNSKYQISNLPALDDRPGKSEILVCHQCSYQEVIPQHCPACASARIKYFGLGTQRVEKAVAELYPQARVLRWDADTTLGKGAHELFLQQFIQGQANLMIGTQMIAKGLDLPLVTLVGVISADTSLRLPDFRAAERTFQLLAQVAGRAGRGLLGGKVIVQSYTPDHYAIQMAAQHDLAGFAKKELAFRRQMDYPPYTRLARLLLHHPNPRHAQQEAERLAAALLPHLKAHGLDKGAIIGPAACFLQRIRDQYRWHIILRAPDPAGVLRNVPLSPNWRVDIDPINLL